MCTKDILYSTIHRVSKNCAKLFWSELRQISTNCGNFWHKDGRQAKIMWGALIFHHTSTPCLLTSVCLSALSNILFKIILHIYIIHSRLQQQNMLNFDQLELWVCEYKIDVFEYFHNTRSNILHYTNLVKLSLSQSTIQKYQYDDPGHLGLHRHTLLTGINDQHLLYFRPPVYGSNWRTYKMLVMFF